HVALPICRATRHCYQLAVFAIPDTDSDLGAVGQPGNFRSASTGLTADDQIIALRVDDIDIAYPEYRPRQMRLGSVTRPILQMHIEAVKRQYRRRLFAGRSPRCIGRQRRMQAVLDQYEPRRECGSIDARNLIDKLTKRIALIDTVSNHLAIGDTTHARLIESPGGALVEMYATVPYAILAGRIVATLGLRHVAQVLQWVDFRPPAGKRISPVDWFVFGHVTRPDPLPASGSSRLSLLNRRR